VFNHLSNEEAPWVTSPLALSTMTFPSGLTITR